MNGRKKLTPQERAKREAKRERRNGRLEAEARAALAEILKQDRKRRHHTVWRKYMEAWGDSAGRVWCQRSGDRFKAATVNLGLQKDFYRLQEMGDETLRRVERLVIDRISDPRDREIARGWIPMFHTVFVLRNRLRSAGISDAEVDEAIEISICNMEENMHADVEGAADGFLEALRRGDASPLEDDSTYFHFARFMGLQFMRTPKAASTSIASLREVPNFDPEAAWGLIRTIFATNISKRLFLERKHTKLCFVEAATSVEFVTGDQPVINLGKTERLEFYYPLTPRRALVILIDQPSASVESRLLTPDEVHRYNALIRDAAMQQVYAASEASLIQLFA